MPWQHKSPHVRSKAAASCPASSNRSACPSTHCACPCSGMQALCMRIARVGFRPQCVQLHAIWLCSNSCPANAMPRLED